MTQAFFTRAGVFATVLCAVALLELVRPRRRLGPHRLSRWAANLGLLATGVFVTVLLWGVLAFSLVEWARRVEAHRVGLLHSVSWPFLIKLAVGFILLDLSVFAQHWALHAVPFLWRLHRSHHSDLDMDASTAVRFHPLEILLSLGVKACVITVFGCHFLSVALFETALSSAALFNHANLKLPEFLDRWLRRVLVTPDMHRVHHSARKGERDSNFGFTTPWWDRLFGTYEAQPHDPHTEMTLGLPELRGPETRSLLWLLKSPFAAS